MTAKTKPEPGPKPDFIEIEDHLYCQTNEGEIVLDLRIPLPRLELFMDMGELGIPQQKLIRYMIDNIIDPEDKATIDGMRDGAKALEILGQFSERLGLRMGATMGESALSTSSSEDTGELSDTTSDTTSD